MFDNCCMKNDGEKCGWLIGECCQKSKCATFMYFWKYCPNDVQFDCWSFIYFIYLYLYLCMCLGSVNIGTLYIQISHNILTYTTKNSQNKYKKVVQKYKNNQIITGRDPAIVETSLIYLPENIFIYFICFTLFLFIVDKNSVSIVLCYELLLQLAFEDRDGNFLLLLLFFSSFRKVWGMWFYFYYYRLGKIVRFCAFWVIKVNFDAGNLWSIFLFEDSLDD